MLAFFFSLGQRPDNFFNVYINRTRIKAATTTYATRIAKFFLIPNQFAKIAVAGTLNFLRLGSMPASHAPVAAKNAGIKQPLSHYAPLVFQVNHIKTRTSRTSIIAGSARDATIGDIFKQLFI